MAVSNNVIVFTIKGITSGAVSAVGKMRSALGTIIKVGALVGAALVAAFSFAVKSIIDVGSKTENLRIRLDALLGSTQEGGKAFKQMAEFASTVPFAYEEIMESATLLAGVVKGGAKEISEFMPIIADIATVSGLTFQETTEQVQRMLAAGSGAAERFREKGIIEMIGFQTGVSTAAKDVKKNLIAAFEDPASKFRGSSLKMATTWDGVLSMIGDKWFTFKSAIADSGIFNFIKAIAIAIDKNLGDALRDSAKAAKETSDTMIGMIKGTLVGAGFLADAWRGLAVVFTGFQLVFANIAEFMITSQFVLTDAWRKFINLFPSFEKMLIKFESTYSIVIGSMASSLLDLANGFKDVANFTGLVDVGNFGALEILVKKSSDNVTVLTDRLSNLAETDNIEPMVLFEAIVRAARDRTAELNLEFDSLLEKEMPSEAVEAFGIQIENIFKTLSTKKDDLIKDMKTPLKKLTEFQKQWELQQKKFFTNMSKSSETFAKSFFALMDSTVKKISAGIATVIVDGGNMMDVFKSIGVSMVKTLLANLITMAIQSKISAISQGVSASGVAGANGVASMALAPFPVNLTAPAFGAAMAVSAASLAAISGAAHGGLTNVPSESTYLLNKGERVLSPNQNKDFTDFISNEGPGSSGNSGIVIENISISILENATNADAIINMDKSEMEELVANPIIDALDSLYDQGHMPKFVRESGA